MADLLPIISGLTALLAVFFGPAMQFLIAKSQQRSSVVSNNRVRWIEEFRRQISEYVAACHLHEVEKNYLRNAECAGNSTLLEHYSKAVDASFFKVNALLHELRMKLDLDDSERLYDRYIWDRLTSLDELDVRDFKNLHDFEDAFLAQVEPLHQAVRSKLALEWQRVEGLR